MALPESESLFKRPRARFGEKRVCSNVAETRDMKQAVLGVALGLDASSPANVKQLEATRYELRTDHEEAVAFDGILFSAHQSDAPASRLAFNPLDARFESVGFAAHAVIHDAVRSVRGGIVGTASQLVPEKEIGDAFSFEKLLKRRAREVRETRAGRPAANIYEEIHGVFAEQFTELRGFKG